MVLPRSAHRPLMQLLPLLLLAAVGLSVLALSMGLLGGRWSPSRAPAVDPIAQATLLALDGIYRDERLTLRLLYSDSVLWARTGDSRWERLLPTGQQTLRAASLGYELDIQPAPPMPPAKRGAGNGAADGPNSSDNEVAPDAGADKPFARIALRVGGFVRNLRRTDLPLINGRLTTPYLRGSMNDWGTSEPMLSTAANLYSVDIPLPAGRHEFKVGSADWNTIDLGGHSLQQGALLGQSLDLVAVGSNLALQVSAAGHYRFTLDLTRPGQPRLLVQRVP